MKIESELSYSLPLFPCLSTIDHSSNNTEVEDDTASLINTLEHELRDLCIQMETAHVQESSLTQSEAIRVMLQSLKMSASSNCSNGSSDPLNDSGDHQLAVGELLCEIEEAKQRVVDMSHKLESESVCRKHSDMQRVAGESALAQAEAEISALQESLREIDEDSQIKSKELKTMELQLKEVHHKMDDLKMQIKETEGTAEMKANEAKDLESSLEQMNHQYKRSELKYERAQSEIESCQKLSVELKTKMIEKVSYCSVCNPIATPSALIVLTLVSIIQINRTTNWNQRRES